MKDFDPSIVSRASVPGTLLCHWIKELHHLDAHQILHEMKEGDLENA